MGKLTAVALKALTRPGRHTDGDGLHLFIRPSGRKGWVLRTMRAGRLRDMGLGGYPQVSLAQAREAAQTARAAIRAGGDPIGERRRVQAAEAAPRRTFRIMAERVIEAQRAGWSNSKHAAQWGDVARELRLSGDR